MGRRLVGRRRAPTGIVAVIRIICGPGRLRRSRWPDWSERWGGRRWVGQVVAECL